MNDSQVLEAPVLLVTAKFSTGEDFQAIGEVVFMDKYIVVYDMDGATGYLFYENLLYMTTEVQ